MYNIYIFIYLFIYLSHRGLLNDFTSKTSTKKKQESEDTESYGRLGKRDPKKEFRNPDELRHPLPTLAWWSLGVASVCQVGFRTQDVSLKIAVHSSVCPNAAQLQNSSPVLHLSCPQSRESLFRP